MELKKDYNYEFEKLFCFIGDLEIKKFNNNFKFFVPFNKLEFFTTRIMCDKFFLNRESVILNKDSIEIDGLFCFKYYGYTEEDVLFFLEQKEIRDDRIIELHIGADNFIGKKIMNRYKFSLEDLKNSEDFKRANGFLKAGKYHSIESKNKSGKTGLYTVKDYRVEAMPIDRDKAELGIDLLLDFGIRKIKDFHRLALIFVGEKEDERRLEFSFLLEDGDVSGFFQRLLSGEKQFYEEGQNAFYKFLVEK